MATFEQITGYAVRTPFALAISAIPRSHSPRHHAEHERAENQDADGYGELLPSWGSSARCDDVVGGRVQRSGRACDEVVKPRQLDPKSSSNLASSLRIRSVLFHAASSMPLAV